jgi:hypothetical protein
MVFNFILLLLLVSLILVSFFALGKLVLTHLDYNLPSVFRIPTGMITYFAGLTMITYFFVHFELSSTLFFALMFLGLILPIFFLRKMDLKISNLSLLIVMSLFLLLNILIAYNRSLGEESFDTIYYLSRILQTSDSRFLTEFNGKGTLNTYISPLDDFNSYYYFLSGIYWLADGLKSMLNLDIMTLTMPIVIWLGSILYWVSSLCILFGFFNVLKIENNYLKSALGLYVVLFVGSLYYHSIFAFYGNTYRTLIAAFISYIVYDVVLHHQLEKKHRVLLMLLGFSILAFSSSGYFIYALLIYALMFYLYFIQSRISLSDVMALVLPIFVFSLNYMTLRLKIDISLSFMIMTFYLLIYVSVRFFTLSLYKIMRVLMVFLVPMIVLLTSVYLHANPNNYPDFFGNYGQSDMYFDVYRFSSFPHIISNTLIWLALAYYLLKSNSSFSRILTVILLLFLNPISFVFLVEFMTGTGFHRAFDTIFNTFTYVILFSFLITYLNQKRFSILFVSLSALLAIHSSTTNYTAFFDKGPDTSGFYRISMDEVNTFEALETILNNEEYSRALVVSQTPTVQGFVRNIETYLDFDNYRSINRYRDRLMPQYSPLWNIFVYRDYTGQKVFREEPAYFRTCTLLIRNQVDFVIVRRDQVYEDSDDLYLPLFFLVRDCARRVYENDSYLLFQLNRSR